MSDLVPRPAPRVLAPATDVDSWTAVAADIARLAQNIASTDFVPIEMRGRPAVVTAAILAGRELGIGPMTSLQHIHLVKGCPGQSAHLMRALTLAAGHDIDYVEVTDTRAVLRGRRAGETDWTSVEFTADQARRARINLGDYPADKLVARATARLCRRKFADVISGLAYATEELDSTGGTDIDGEAPSDPPPEPGTAKRRTVRRPATPAPGMDRAAAEKTPPRSTTSGPPPPGAEHPNAAPPTGQSDKPGPAPETKTAQEPAPGTGRAVAGATTRNRGHQNPPPPSHDSNPAHTQEQP